MDVNVFQWNGFDFSERVRSFNGTHKILTASCALALFLFAGTFLVGQTDVELTLDDPAIEPGGSLSATVRITNASEQQISVKRPKNMAASLKLTADGETIDTGVDANGETGDVSLYPGESIVRTVSVRPEKNWDQARKLNVTWTSGDLSAGPKTAYYFPERYGKIQIRGYGPLYLELFYRDAPRTLFHLFRLIREDVYDGLTFHRLIKGYLLQGGKPEESSDLTSRKIPPEFSDRPHEFGTVSMAHGHRSKKSGTQFFITLGRQPFLDGRNTVIGTVKDASGRDLLRRIQNEVTTDHDKQGGQCGIDHQDRPLEPLVMKRVSLISPETYEQEQNDKTGDAGESPRTERSSGGNDDSSGSTSGNR